MSANKFNWNKPFASAEGELGKLAAPFKKVGKNLFGKKKKKRVIRRRSGN